MKNQDNNQVENNLNEKSPLEVMDEFFENFINSQVEVDPEIQQVIDENFMDLI